MEDFQPPFTELVGGGHTAIRHAIQRPSNFRTAAAGLGKALHPVRSAKDEGIQFASVMTNLHAILVEDSC